MPRGPRRWPHACRARRRCGIHGATQRDRDAELDIAIADHAEFAQLDPDTPLENVQRCCSPMAYSSVVVPSLMMLSTGKPVAVAQRSKCL